MITTCEVKEFLKQYGVTAQDFIIDCLIAKVEEKEACFDDTGYSDCDKSLIALYTVSVLVLGQAPTRIESDKRPSGAARAYENTDSDIIKSSLINNIATLDTAGCVNSLLPNSTDTAFFAVVKGCA